MTRLAKTTRTALLGFLALALALIALPATAKTTTKTGSFYKVTLETTTKAGKQVATITIVGTNGYKCNKSYPWKLTLTPSGGAAVEKAKYKKGDATKLTEKKVVFTVPYTPAEGGKIDAKLKLSCCDDKQCQMETVELSWK